MLSLSRRITKERVPWVIAALLCGGHVIWAIFSRKVIGLGPRGGHSIYVSYKEMPVFFLISIFIYTFAAFWFARLTFKDTES